MIDQRGWSLAIPLQIGVTSGRGFPKEKTDLYGFVVDLAFERLFVLYLKAV